MSHPRYQLLLKEIELLDGTVKNLDDLVHKTKNFGIVLWGGGLSILLGRQEALFENMHMLVLMTAVIPILFWIMDYPWRKHLLLTSQRQRVISRFINSTQFQTWLDDGEIQPRFPLYDTAGWIYIKGMEGQEEYGQEYLVDQKTVAGFRKVLLYKEAKWFYSIMILISLSMGLALWPSG